ncbi:MAG TPA: hypothetical protein VMR37_04940 [Rhabdochlamydiaceae bacterium]|nr:hypothetical protein [Rhabdochlamydiaceae bacterium]
MATIYTNAANFVNLVAQQADARLYPEMLIPKIVNALDTSTYAGKMYLDRLPREIQQKLYVDYMGHNNGATFSTWLASTRCLEPPLANNGEESVKRAAIEGGARQRLLDLNQVIDPSKTAMDQLLEYIFQQAFTRVPNDTRPDGREAMIQQSKALTPQLSRELPFEFWRLRYKVESFVSKLLDNFLVKIGLIYLTYKVGVWAQPRINYHLSRTVISHGVRLIMNNAPLPIIRVLSKGIQFVQWTTRNYLEALIGFAVAKGISGFFPPLIKRAVTMVETAVYFPSKVAGYLFMGPFWIFWYSWDAHSKIAKNVRSLKDGSQAHYFERGGLQAYRVWMDIMRNGARAGFFPRPAAPPATARSS